MQVTDISPALSKLWNSLEGTNQMRACLFNLIFLSKKKEEGAYIHTLAQKVIEKFPSRIILFNFDELSQEIDPSANVSVLPGAKGEYDIVCDLIEISLSSHNVNRMYSCVLAHLLPDLPTYVVWLEDPLQVDLLSHGLHTLASKIIFDSETTSDLVAYAKKIIDYKQKTTCALADLNWVRMEKWREILSITFHTNERLEQLKDLRSMTITYNAAKTPAFCHTKVQALYLQFWLASQLGWTHLKSEEESFIYASKTCKEPITIFLEKEHLADFESGALLNVELKLTEERVFSFTIDPRFPSEINIKLCTATVCDIPLKHIFTKTELGVSLGNEICHHSTSEHYINMLQFISQGAVSCL